MFTKTVTWPRWTGRRSDVTAAIQIALEEVERRSGIAASADVGVQFTRGLTQRTDDPLLLDTLQRDELRRIADIDIWVEPDREALINRAIAAARDQQPDPERVEMHIKLRFWSWALTVGSLEIKAPERGTVEGVAARIVEVLDRGRPRIPVPTGQLAWPIVAGAAIIGAVLTELAGHAFGIGRGGGGIQGIEWFTFAVGAIAFGLLGFLVTYVLPPFEIVDETTRLRSERFRGWVIGSVVAIPGTLLAALIYDLLRR